MNRRGWLFGISVTGLFVGLGIGAGVFADAGDTFEELYGKKIRDVKVTRGVEDDIELAETIWSAAETIKDSKVLRGLMLEAIYGLTARTDVGVKLGVDALRELEGIYPKKASVYRKQMVGIWEMAYRKSKGAKRKEAGRELVEMMIEQGHQLVKLMRVREANAVYRKALGIGQSVRLSNVKYLKALVNHATSLIGVVREIEKLEKMRKGGSLEEEDAKRLARLYVVKFDSPELAKGVLSKLDKVEKALIEGAMLELESASVEQCGKLWAWYYELSDGERGLVALNVLSRAEGYLKRYLDEAKETLSGTDRLKLELSLGRIEARLDKLREALGIAGQWKDLTKYYAKMVATKKYGRRDGEVTFKDGVFSFSGEATWMHYPARAKDVIISAQIKKIDGYYVRVGGRLREMEEGGRYTAQLGTDQSIILKLGKRMEINRQTVKETEHGKTFQMQFAILGSRLVVAVNGKKVMEMKDERNAKAGGIFFGTGHAKAEISKMRIMLPTKEQGEKFLAGLK